jgi:hypothetical protein
MSYEIPNFYVGVLPSNIDMSTLGFIAAKVIPASATLGAGFGGAALGLPSAGGKIAGVVQNKPVIGEPAQLMVSGVSKCLANEAFAVGDMLMVDANGKFLLATTGNQVVGIALESGVAGAVVAVLLKDIGLI